MTIVPILSFRFKILLLVVAILSGAIGFSMVVTQNRLEATYQKLFARQYDTQIDFFNSRQKMALAGVMDQCQKLADDGQFVSAVASADSDAVLRIAAARLGTLLPQNPASPAGARGQTPEPQPDGDDSADDAEPHPMRRVPVPNLRDPNFSVYDAKGIQLLAEDRSHDVLTLPRISREQLKKLAGDSRAQQVGYFRSTGEGGFDYLMSLVVTPVVSDRNDELAGAIMMGLQVVDFGGLERSAPVQSGIVLGGSLFSSSIPVTLRKQLLKSLSAATEGRPDDATSFDIQLNDEPYRCFVKALNPGSVFPVALNMSLYSLADQDQDIRVMRLRVLAFGCLVFLVGCLLAWLISQRLAIPLNELVVGTQEIEKGNYDYNVRVRSRDEVGKLAFSFNQMAVGLALKEKYQSVLNQVTDREVARELMTGQLALGGVMLPVTVLFCDIRGFSVMSQKLPPAEVVQMLNEHMTAMTRIAYEFRGVVDKFVGDMIMVVFGAPKSYGNDAENAVRCAMKMIESRRELNVLLARKIEVGIGIATGEVLAGCMGSEDRLNYTVLGEKVNLGSRLCDTADRMEVLMDEETHRVLGGMTEVETRDGIELKGFEEAVRAYRVIKLRES